jgi:hypothetical protein
LAAQRVSNLLALISFCFQATYTSTSPPTSCPGVPLLLGFTQKNGERYAVDIALRVALVAPPILQATRMTKIRRSVNFKSRARMSQTSQLLYQHTVAGSLSSAKNSIPLQSSKSGLFRQNTRVGCNFAEALLENQQLTNSCVSTVCALVTLPLCPASTGHGSRVTPVTSHVLAPLWHAAPV